MKLPILISRLRDDLDTDSLMATYEEIFAKQTKLIQYIENAITNFKKMGQAKMTHAAATSRLERVKDAFRDIRNLDAKLQVLATEEHRSKHAYFKEAQFDNCELQMDAALDYFTEMTAPVTQNSSMDLSHASNDIPIAPRPISRLPRIDLPTFDGTFERWETFRDRFKSMIVNDPSLTNIERLHYLCSSVSGPARNALSQLTITEANFDVAWRILSARYENKRRLVNSHLESLWSLPAAAHDSSKDLQTLLDSSDMSIHALKNLGCPVDTWDDVLVFLVSQKLDKTTRKAWELKLEQSKEPPLYADLHVFLESRIRAFEVLAPKKASNSIDATASKTKTVKSLSSHATSVKFQCSVCKEQHPLYQCSQFLSYTPERRFEFIKTNKRCYNCLASNHALKDCKNQYRCRECRQKHHSLLHLSKPTESPCEEAANSSESIKTNQVEKTVSLSVAMPATVKRAVILATARVRVHSPHGRFVLARALIDQGSVATLMSENLAQLLRLPRMKHYVCVTGIGQIKSAARHAASVSISPASSNEPAYSTTAIILPSLTQYIPVRVPSNTQWTHIQNLPLADTDFSSSDPIDIILGAELYAAILRHGLKKGAPDEPIAQNTTLGWILSGSVSNSRSRETIHAHHGAVVDDLDKSLRRFWEIEDFPSRHFLTHEEQQCELHFLSTHYRNNDGRYIVRLPFRDGPPRDLGNSKRSALASLHRLERRFQRDPSTAAEYSAFLAEYENLNHGEVDSYRLA